MWISWLEGCFSEAGVPGSNLAPGISFMQFLIPSVLFLFGVRAGNIVVERICFDQSEMAD